MHEIKNELLLDECVIQQGNRIVFFAVDDFCVTLCVPDGCMAKQLAGCVNVHPRRQGKGRECVPTCVKADVLINASFLHPITQYGLVTSVQLGEHWSVRRCSILLRQPFSCIHVQRKIKLDTRLELRYFHLPLAVILYDMLPTKAL